MTAHASSSPNPALIEFTVGDTKARGYLATPASGNGPGVLVLHAWWGLNGTFTGVCDRLAAEGFVAFAPDLFRGRITTTIEQAEELLGSLDFDANRQLAADAATYLRGLSATTGDGLGIVGFSMGAMGGAHLATVKQPDVIKAVVMFYGVGFEDASAYRQSQAVFQAHFAPNDLYATDEEVNEARAAMTEAGKTLTEYTYPGTKHWFFEPDRPEYDAESAEQAWQRTIAFLHEQLG